MAELDHRPAHVLVDVVDVDITCTSVVGGAGERTSEFGVLDARVDEDVLAGLDIRADLDGHRCVPLEPYVYCSCHTSSLSSGIRRPSEVMPAMATSGPPIMKSVCTPETFAPRSLQRASVWRPTSSGAENSTAAP